MKTKSLKGKLSYQPGQKNNFYILFRSEGFEKLLRESKNIIPFFYSKREEISFTKVFDEKVFNKREEGSSLKKFINLFEIKTSLKEESLLMLGTELEKLEYVEYCDIIPQPVSVDMIQENKIVQNYSNSSTPNFYEQGLQGYLEEGSHYTAPEKPIGMNVINAWEMTKGEGITIRVCSYGVNTDHENLEGSDIEVEIDRDCNEKSCASGTAVTGAIIAQHKDFGIRGIAPESKVVFYDIYPKNAILDAEHGDIVHIGLVYPVEDTESGKKYRLPFIHYKTNWDLVSSASRDGITCIFDAGSGSNNEGTDFSEGIDLLNSPEIFNDWGNSLGIMACACDSETGERKEYCNYNMHYSLNSWGDSVISTGSYDPFFVGDATGNRDYTNSVRTLYGSLIVGALALVNSYIKDKKGKAYSPLFLYSVVGVSTGYYPGSEIVSEIGMRPNVLGAMKHSDKYPSYN